MTDEGHLDRWRAAEKAVENALGGKPRGFALVYIDPKDGSVGWGGDFSQDEAIQRAIEHCLRTMLHDCHKSVKRSELSAAARALP